MKKERLDKLLVLRNFFDSRTTAQRFILAGKVLVNNVPETKVGTKVNIESEIRLKNAVKKYVSRGGKKLEIAVKKWKLDFSGMKILDVGISTGGFTDCALQNGAESIVGVDVGYGQVALKIKDNPKVTIFEKTNAKNMNLNTKFDWIICDVSFISIIKLLDTFKNHLNENGRMVLLIKPQFEAGKQFVEKGGIVKNPEVHQRVIETVKNEFLKYSFELIDIIESDILLPKGNLEYLSFWKHLSL